MTNLLIVAEKEVHYVDADNRKVDKGLTLTACGKWVKPTVMYYNNYEVAITCSKCQKLRPLAFQYNDTQIQKYRKLRKHKPL